MSTPHDFSAGLKDPSQLFQPLQELSLNSISSKSIMSNPNAEFGSQHSLTDSNSPPAIRDTLNFKPLAKVAELQIPSSSPLADVNSIEGSVDSEKWSQSPELQSFERHHRIGTKEKSMSFREVMEGAGAKLRAAGKRLKDAVSLPSTTSVDSQVFEIGGTDDLDVSSNFSDSTIASTHHSRHQSSSSDMMRSKAAGNVTHSNSPYVDLNSSRRAYEEVLMGLKVHESALARAITALIKTSDAVTSDVAQLFASMGPGERLNSSVSQHLISKATFVVVAIKKLSKSGIESISTANLDLYPNYARDIESHRRQIHEQVRVIVEQIQLYLSKNEFYLNKDSIFLLLNDLTHSCKALIDFVDTCHRPPLPKRPEGHMARDLYETQKAFVEADVQLDFKFRAFHTLPQGSATQDGHQSKIDSNVQVYGEGEYRLFQSDDPERPNDVSCSKCHKILMDSHPVLRYRNRHYHSGCFHCTKCAKPVTTQRFLTTSNHAPLCSNCSPSCSKCLQPVVSNLYRWKETIFHLQCFQCVRCGDPLQDSLTHIYRRQGKPCCTRCAVATSGNVSSSLRTPAEGVTSESSDHSVSSLESMAAALSRISAKFESHGLRIQTGSEQSSLIDFSQSTGESTELSSPTNAVNLSLILSQDFGVEWLIEFCTADYSLEKILFWLDVQQYRALPSDATSRVHSSALSIYQKYMAVGADMELRFSKASIIDDIQSTMRRHFERRAAVSSGKMTAEEAAIHDKELCTVFNAAQADMFEQLEAGVLPSFLASSFGQQYLHSLNCWREGRAVPRPASAMSDVSLRDPDRILRITVLDYVARYDDPKHFVYALQVLRAGNADDLSHIPVIYRRYSEFYELHLQITLAFPGINPPTFPSKTFLKVRDGKRSVADNRCRVLNEYLLGLMQLPDEVSNSALVRSFMEQRDSDVAQIGYADRLAEIYS